MRARWIVNLVLLLVLVALSLAIRHELNREASPQTLAGIDAGDLSLIEVERDGEPRIRLERTPDGWRMREPLEIDADQARVDQLLGILAAPVHRSFPEQSAALGELGLATPRLRLRLDSLTLAFGGLDPLDQHRYVSADGLVHLIDDRFHHLLVAPPLDYCSRALLPRGRPPAFGTINGVPLAEVSLAALTAVRAERLEPVGGDLSGTPVQIKYADGRALRLLVSEDRRRWDRLDLRVRYVLADGPALDQDPTALDPTPPEPPPTPKPQGRAWPPPELMQGPGGPAPADLLPAPDSAAPVAPLPDPDATLPGDLPLGTPPAVRLHPDDQALEEVDGKGFGAEPYKEPPQGFGLDPFAPDPEQDPNLDPQP